ncbi:MAG: hypothetical protein RLZ55_1724 [Actinomycetota bacterium]|jgi:cell wall-associated NlpC family hydrolase
MQAAVRGILAGATIATAVLVAGALPATANYPDPPGAAPFVSPQADVAPAVCASGAPAGSVLYGVNVKAVCDAAVAGASTYEAAAAVRFGFSVLGTGYSQDYTLRRTTQFDCSSFVGRAFVAGGGTIRTSGGSLVPFFPYFGWTGAYVTGGNGYGYSGTNLARLGTKAELKPGDIMIQFNGADPANSLGNDGHAMMYLGNGLAIQAGTAPDGQSKVSVVRHVNSFSNEWYFRYTSLNGPKPPVTPPPVTPPPVTPPPVQTKAPLAAGTVLKLNAYASNATVMGDLTATKATAGGYATVYPCNEGRPKSSNLNYVPGRSLSNFVFARSDSAGYFCIYVSAPVHIVWDKVLTTQVMAIHNATRRLDTRLAQYGGTPVAANSVRKINTGTAQKTAVGTLTVASPAAPGRLTAFACDQPVPNATSLSFQGGRSRAGTVAIQSDAQGNICVFSTATTHLVWDQVSETKTVPSATPTRLFDSRFAWLGGTGPVSATTTARVQTHGANRTAFGTLTVTGSWLGGNATVFSCADGKPLATSISFQPGETISNFVAAKTGADGNICVSSSTPVHVIWDQVSTSTWYRADNPVRTLDTRE